MLIILVVGVNKGMFRILVVGGKQGHAQNIGGRG